MHRKEMDASGAEAQELCFGQADLTSYTFIMSFMELLSGKREQSSGIGSAGLGHIHHGLLPQFGNALSNGGHKRWFIPLAASRDWSKKWTIGFNKKSVLWHFFGTSVCV